MPPKFFYFLLSNAFLTFTEMAIIIATTAMVIGGTRIINSIISFILSPPFIYLHYIS